MRNSVILVDQIEQDMAAGHDAFTAIVESAVRRFRPITLTAAAAVLALIPLAGEVFWAPMALAMMGGLIAATILTLTFLPALYALSFRVRTPAGDRATALRGDAVARDDEVRAKPTNWLKAGHGVVFSTAATKHRIPACGVEQHLRRLAKSEIAAPAALRAASSNVAFSRLTPLTRDVSSRIPRLEPLPGVRRDYALDLRASCVRPSAGSANWISTARTRLAAMACEIVITAASALDEIDRQPAERGLLVLRLHVGAGLAHGLDDAVERHAVRAVAVQRQPSGGDRLDRAEGVALDARDLDEPADRVAGQAEVCSMRDLGRVLDLLVACRRARRTGPPAAIDRRRRPRPDSRPRRPKSRRSA